MSSSNTTTYDHTQAGTVTRVVFLVTIPPLCLLWWFMSSPMFTVLPVRPVCTRQIRPGFGD